MNPVFLFIKTLLKVRNDEVEIAVMRKLRVIQKVKVWRKYVIYIQVCRLVSGVSGPLLSVYCSEDQV